MKIPSKLPQFIYSDLIKDFVAKRAQDAAIIEIYLIQELQKKFLENGIQYFPRIRSWEGAKTEIILQKIDAFSKIILKEIKVMAQDSQGLWRAKNANLSNFINTNVKYVNREKILKQLQDLSTWKDIKFLNEERFSFIEIEKICTEYFAKNRKQDQETTGYPLDDLKKEFYSFMKILHTRRDTCFSYFMNCLFATMQNLWSNKPIKRVILAAGKNTSGKTALMMWGSKLPRVIHAQNFSSSQISGIQFEWNSGRVFPPNCPLVYCDEIRIVESEGFPKDKMSSDFMNMLKSAVRPNQLIKTRNPREEAQEYESRSLVVFNANSDAERDELYHICQSYFAPFKVWDRVKFVQVDILDLIPGIGSPKYPEIYKSFYKIRDMVTSEGFNLEKHFPYVVLNFYADCLKKLEYDELSQTASVDMKLFNHMIRYVDKDIFDKMLGFQEEFKTGESLKEKSKEEKIIEELFLIFDEEFPKDLEQSPGEALNTIATNLKERISSFHHDRTKKWLGKTFMTPRLPMIKITQGYSLPCIHNSQLKRIFDDNLRWTCKKYEKYFKKDDKQGSQSISSTTFYLQKWRADHAKKEAENKEIEKKKKVSSQKKD